MKEGRRLLGIAKGLLIELCRGSLLLLVHGWPGGWMWSEIGIERLCWGGGWDCKVVEGERLLIWREGGVVELGGSEVGGRITVQTRRGGSGRV